MRRYSLLQVAHPKLAVVTGMGAQEARTILWTGHPLAQALVDCDLFASPSLEVIEADGITILRLSGKVSHVAGATKELADSARVLGQGRDSTEQPAIADHALVDVIGPRVMHQAEAGHVCYALAAAWTEWRRQGLSRVLLQAGVLLIGFHGPGHQRLIQGGTERESPGLRVVKHRCARALEDSELVRGLVLHVCPVEYGLVLFRIVLLEPLFRIVNGPRHYL